MHAKNMKTKRKTGNKTRCTSDPNIALADKSLKEL